ncbi:MAG: TetR/AcrR family transcriptional regulator [Solirubrobacteraceae bacterium]|nr:TetR/AcrR family transcriptional regulator [Solirubrobacteraceae bacterium]
MTTTDGRLLRGEQTRRAILERAAEIATVEGLEGLSIGRLAGELGVSKSGVFAHFGSKEELQLATIERAREVFIERVIEPALRERGLARLWAMCENRIAYAKARVFPGGCFFYAAEMEFGPRPGRVRDALRREKAAWWAWLVGTIERARDAGELEPTVDAEQLAFELDAFVGAANADALLDDDPVAFDRARAAMRARLRAVATDPERVG